MTDFKMPPEAELPFTTDSADGHRSFSLQQATEGTEEEAEIVKSVNRASRIGHLASQ